jgi:hypothetical protein
MIAIEVTNPWENRHNRQQGHTKLTIVEDGIMEPFLLSEFVLTFPSVYYLYHQKWEPFILQQKLVLFENCHRYIFELRAKHEGKEFFHEKCIIIFSRLVEIDLYNYLK